MQARRRMRAAMVVALGAAAVLPALAATAGSASASALGPDPALSGTPNPSWWGTNGRVMEILPVGNRVYLAGGFDYVGPATGYGVGVDAAGGSRLPGAPVIDGVVRAAVADGQGGWFIGGDFKNVGGQYRRYAAQVTAAGAVTGWNPKPDQPVEALAFDGTTVFLGGAFTTVRDTPVPRLAAVAGTGAANLVPGFQPAPDGRVTSLVLSGGALFAGGEFGAIGGAAHARVARLDRATGAASAAFTAGTDQPVRAITASPDGTSIYAGGDFSQADGTGRAHLAAFDATTGALLPWAPSADDVVRALAVDPASGVVAAGGQFRSVSGVARARLALLDGAGAVLPFDAALNGCQTRHTTSDAHANPACDTEVDALTAANGVLYVGGRFSRSGATSRHDVAAFTLADGALHGWNPVASDRVLALAASGGGIFVGGELTSVNGGVRPNLAALDAATGQLDPSFNPVVDDEVLDIAVAPDGARLYLAGHFSTVGGKKHNRMAAVSLATGAEDKAFKPNFNNDVLSIGVVGQSVYVGGQFTKVTKVTRKHVAKIDPVTGAADPAFTADTVGPNGPLTAGGMVQSLQVAPDGSKVFLAGPFNTVNGVAKRGIAVVDGTTGTMLPQQLGGVQQCWANGDWITHLYLSPDGQRLYGGDVCPDNIYQWDAAHLSTPANPTGLNWRTWCNAGMQGTLEVNGHFFYGSHGGDKGSGGRCAQSPGGGQVDIARYAVFDQVNGNLLPDRVQLDSAMGVWSFAAVPGGLLVGGDFTFVNTTTNVHQGLAFLPGTP